MTQPRRAYQDKAGNRWYFSFDPNSRYYGVTSAIGVLDKPWLAPWYASEVAGIAVEILMDVFDYFDDNLFSSEYIMPFLVDGKPDSFGYPYGVDWEALEKLLAQAPILTRDTAGDRGDKIHDYLADLMVFSKGNPKKAWAYYEHHAPDADLDSWIRPVLQWLDENEVEAIEVEATLYNDTHGYAGSCDLIARVNGVVRYIDWKTSGTVGDTFALQVAAYAHAEYIISDDDIRKDVPNEDVEGGIMHLQDGSAKFIDIDISDEMFDAFLSCLLIKQLWFDGARKGAIGKALWKSKKTKEKK